MNALQTWLARHLSNPQVVSLAVLLLVTWCVMTFFTSVFAPIFTAVVVAYLLDAPVTGLVRLGTPRWLATTAVWLSFAVLLIFLLVLLVPRILQQIAQLATEVPALTVDLRERIQGLSDRYPDFLSKEQAQSLAGGVGINLGELRQQLLSRTHLLGVGLAYGVVYLVLVPFIVFFLIKDKDLILGWLRRFLPNDIGLISCVWADVNGQLGNYVRGKAMEIVVVATVTAITFHLLGLNYAVLLGAVTGVSVLVPWVGATLVTFPVAVVAYTQFGAGAEMAYVLLAYGVIQALDGNVLVPVLFSETNGLHPVAIIIAVLFFGMTYGVWGVFFAIPLATAVAAVINAWPDASAPSPLAEATNAEAPEVAP